MVRLLVCGGRDFNSLENMLEWVSEIGKENEIEVIIHGGARGADTLADKVANHLGINTQVFPAKWDLHGKSAGPIRNQQMIDDGKPTLVLAAPGGRGTADMIKRALKAGIPTLIKGHLP